LNGHLAGSASNGLAFWLSDKTVLKVADLSVNCQPQKCSAATLVFTGDVSLWGYPIHWGYVKKERQVGELYSQLSRMLFTDAGGSLGRGRQFK